MQSQNLTRTFICIDLPPSLIEEVAKIQFLISAQKFTGKLIESENLHLTLKFLGHISYQTLQQVKEKLSTIQFKLFEATIQEAGTFSYKDNPRIVWLKISNISQLQKQIDYALSPIFPKEQRFMSHLTIARIKYVKSPTQFTEYISQIKPKKLQFLVNQFKLKSSELKPLGPTYTTLETYYSQ